MKVTIDREQCIGCALCWSDSPELFEEDAEKGWSRIVAPLRVSGDPSVGEAPESMRKAAQAAADGCPVAIIQVE